MGFRSIRKIALLAALGLVVASGVEGAFAAAVPMAAQKNNTAPSSSVLPASLFPTSLFPASLFPASIGDWKLLSSVPNSALAASGSTYAPAWQEFGLQQAYTAHYAQDGATLVVQALVFTDATGSYGAFTLLHAAGSVPLMPLRIEPVEAVSRPAHRERRTEEQLLPLTRLDGAHAGQSWLFYRGNLLLQAEFSRPVPDELLLLRKLDQALPQVFGPRAVPPSLPNQLPRQGLDVASVRYAIGPLAYRLAGGVLPVELIHFEQSAEAVTAQYGKGTLTLLSYPTPEIADARMGALAAALSQGAVAGTPGAVLVKRAGMTVAVTSGGFTPQQARALLAQIQFRMTVSIDQLRTPPNEVQKTAKLLTSIVLLILILAGIAIVLGVLIGGGRVLYRIARGKSPSVMNDVEFIHLDLAASSRVEADTESGPQKHKSKDSDQA